MSVKIKKHGSKWYVYVNYHCKRKNRAVGTREAAEKVRRALEARLALGDASFLNETEHEVPTFQVYAGQWLKTYAEVHCKQSTMRSYEQLLRLHVMPRFGSKLLSDIRRDEVKRFVAELSQATREVNGASILRFSRNTLRLIISALRAVLNAALEDGIVDCNPASKVGKFAKTEKPARQASAMTRKETEEFLAAVREVRPRWYPFFLTALRAGLRKGELIALNWGDIHFGDSANDPNRYIFVQRSYYQGCFTTPKETGRAELISQNTCVGSCWNCATSECSRPPLPDRSIADDFVFTSQAGTMVKPDNIARRHMNPALVKAGLHRFRFHDLRHTFGSLLIQGGASLAYVKDQMGHRSIQVTVDIYGHLVPSANIASVDRRDGETSLHHSAPGMHQAR